MSLAPKLSERTFVLADVIDRALHRLQPRDRVIVHRCDIDEEPFIQIAADLGISVRHLYRERRRILEALAQIIVECSDDATRVYSEPEPNFEDELRISRVLEENGDLRTAEGIIERLLTECPEVECYRFFLKLAELHARAGHFTRAQRYVDIAEARVSELGLGCAQRSAELSLARAFVFEECGQGDAGIAKYAAHAVALARSAQTYRYDAETARILFGALVLSGKSMAARGHPKDLRRLCSEAAEIASLVQHPDEEMRMSLHFLTFVRDILCDFDLPSARAHLSQATNIARSAGFTLSSMMCTTNLASTYRLGRNPLKAVNTLVNILPVARRLGNSNVLLAALIDLADSYTELGRIEQAQMLLVEGANVSTENEWLRASLLRTSAKVSVATNQYTRALDEARSAETAFAALGKTRLLGTVLRLQGEALFALGDRRPALRSLSRAIELLSATNTDLALSKAYGVLGRLTGDHRHISRARALAAPKRNA